MTHSIKLVYNDPVVAADAVIEIEAGEYLPYLQVPSRLGYSFDGWFYDPETTQRCRVFAQRINSDMTLYAGWAAPETDYSQYYLDARTAECHFLGKKDENKTLPDFKKPQGTYCEIQIPNYKACYRW